MVIKMTTIDGAHAANAINYVLDKEKARKEDKPVFLASNNIELNPMTGKPYSPVDVLMEMQLLQSVSKHHVSNPFWRIELCPPKEVCQDWTMEQWDDFHRDCVSVLDSTDYMRHVVKDKKGKPVIDKRTGMPKVKVYGKHTQLANSQYVATVHFDTGKPHVHIVANRLTMDDQMQDPHKCEVRAMMAANIIAEKYGWTKAEDRENKRMERIHETAMNVLKRMDNWDIETYFAEMRRNGFEVEPTYDSKGICRGYSIGEKLYDLDGNYSSTVMYKASARKFGHGRNLTVSKLHDTWLKQHPEKTVTASDEDLIQRTGTHTVNPFKATEPKVQNIDGVHQVAKSKDNDVHSQQTEPVAQEQEAAKPTKGEGERNIAIWLAERAISRFIKSPFKTEFSLHGQKDILPEGIVANAINMGEDAGFSFSEDNLKQAAQAFLGSAECGAERIGETAEKLLDVIADIALPETQPSIGGVSGNNELPKKKDDEWQWWKKNGFVKSQRNRGLKR